VVTTCYQGVMGLFSALKKSGFIEVKKPLEPQEKGLSKM
jgi:hypothetical protein